MIEKQLARLIRHGKVLGLESQTNDFITAMLESRIANAIGKPHEEANNKNSQDISLQSSEPVLNDIASQSIIIETEEINDLVSSKGEASLRLTVNDQTVHQIELTIRTLVNADSPWKEIQPHTTHLLNASGTPENGARVLELAFLRGSNKEVQQTLALLNGNIKDYYKHIHQAVRAHLVARLWKDGNAEELSMPLYASRNEDFLQPIERLFAFFSMTQIEDQTSAFIYYRKFKETLIEAILTIGPHIGIDEGYFKVVVAKIAISLGYDGEANELLENISPDNQFFEDALKLSLETKAEHQRAGYVEYKEALLVLHSSEKRIALLQSYFAKTRDLGGIRDRNRPALNDLLKTPIEYFDEIPETLNALSHTLVENRDLLPLLPNVLELFRVNALKFHKPEIDAAIWAGPQNISGNSPRDIYWRGVGLIHRYMNQGSLNEKSLWAAKEHIEYAKAEWKHPIPYSWKQVHGAAISSVTKSIFITESDRQVMLKQLRVSGETDQVTINDIESYLLIGNSKPIPVLRNLEHLARSKKAYTLEIELVLARAKVTHLTNEDLNRIWQLANAKTCSDLSWRVASVLCARQTLKSAVRHSWDISGEKRKNYSLLNIEKPLAELCYKEFDRKGKRLCYALLQVGPLLPELLAYLDPTSRAYKLPSPVNNSPEAAIESHLSELKWLSHSRKAYHFGFQGRDAGIPGFIQVLPSNSWSTLVAKLSEDLGINSWGWSLSRLNSQIVDLIPRLASRQDLKKHSGKIARWLKNLKPEQRAAWQEMAQLSRVMSDEEAKETIAVFVCQLATVILQNHYLALTSLQSMRAPVGVIWRFENWMLSDSYTKIRRSIGTNTRVLVPNSLQRINTIVED